MEHKPLIVANWKMNLGYSECLDLARSYCDYWTKSGIGDHVELVLCPPTTSLVAVALECQGSPINYGAQNVFWQEKGAYTGEIAASTLVEIGCRYVIIGHSERRQYIGETDEMVNRKVHAALDAGLIPILCVGENYEQRRENISDLVLMQQVIEGLRGIAVQSDQRIIIAYEPVWVIGTGQALEPDMAEHAAQVIRQALIDLFPLTVVDAQTRILYGGSVDDTNIRSFTDIPGISGALVGTASISHERFIKLLERF